MTVRVVYTARAERQLANLYNTIADASGLARADAYVSRIKDQCEALRDFPERGKPRFDIRPGLRTMGYQRRSTIVYAFEAGIVAILGVFYGGQDFERRLDEELEE